MGVWRKSSNGIAGKEGMGGYTGVCENVRRKHSPLAYSHSPLAYSHRVIVRECDGGVVFTENPRISQ